MLVSLGRSSSHRGPPTAAAAAILARLRGQRPQRPVVGASQAVVVDATPSPTGSRRTLATAAASSAAVSGDDRPLRAVIAGGGVGGLALAYFLQRLGGVRVQATVIERRAEGEADPAAAMGLGVWVNALRCLEVAGLPLPEALAAAGRPHSWMLDSGFTSVDGRVLARPGTPLVPGKLLFTRRGHLLETLREAALAAGATVRSGESVEGFEVDEDTGAVHIQTKTKGGGGSGEEPSSSATTTTADLLVGAEGMWESGIRRRLLLQQQLGGNGDGVARPASRGYAVYRGVAEGTPLSPGFSFQTWGPGRRRFASVPLADGQVWFATLPLSSSESESDEENAGADEGTDGGHHARLLAAFGGWHDPIPTLLRATAPGAVLRDRAAAFKAFPPFGDARAARGRWPVSLVGDAAHGVDPILAQGAGVAVEDAFALAGALAAAAAEAKAKGRDGRIDVAAALRAFEAATQRRAELLTAVSDVSQALGQLQSPALVSLRDAAFRLAPQWVKGRVFDSYIRASLARTVGEALSMRDLGYEPEPPPGGFGHGPRKRGRALGGKERDAG